MHTSKHIFEFFEKIKERYKNHIGIDDFQLAIDEYDFGSPEANRFSIRIPIEYIKLIKLNCNLILCNQNLFKEIGNCKNEIFDKKKFKIHKGIFTVLDFMQLNNLDSEKIPINDTRKEFASYLSQLIVTFIIYHELGHVRQINYPSEKEVHKHIEFESYDADVFKEQAKEVDADVFAVNFLCRNLFHIMDNEQGYQFNLLFKTKGNLLHLGIYAIVLFFYLSNSDDSIYNDQEKHPHPIIRLDNCMGSFQEACILNGKIENKEQFAKLMQSVLSDFASTLSFHFGLDNNTDYYKRFRDPDVKRVKEILVKYIKEDNSLNHNRPYNLDA